MYIGKYSDLQQKYLNVYMKNGDNYTTNNVRFLKDTQTIVNNTQRISKCDKPIWDEDTR
jgi:hypothetical protein